MDVTAEIHCVSSKSPHRFWPCSPRSPTRNLFRWSRRQPGRAVDSMQFEFLALCVARCNLSLLSLASYLLPPISSWSKGRTRESLGNRVKVCLQKSAGWKDQKTIENRRLHYFPGGRRWFDQGSIGPRGGFQWWWRRTHGTSLAQAPAAFRGFCHWCVHCWLLLCNCATVSAEWGKISVTRRQKTGGIVENLRLRWWLSPVPDLSRPMPLLPSADVTGARKAPQHKAGCGGVHHQDWNQLVTREQNRLVILYPTHTHEYPQMCV